MKYCLCVQCPHGQSITDTRIELHRDAEYDV